MENLDYTKPQSKIMKNKSSKHLKNLKNKTQTPLQAGPGLMVEGRFALLPQPLRQALGGAHAQEVLFDPQAVISVRFMGVFISLFSMFTGVLYGFIGSSAVFLGVFAGVLQCFILAVLYSRLLSINFTSILPLIKQVVNPKKIHHPNS